MRKVALIASPALWEHGHGQAHPLKPERLRRTYDLLQAYGALKQPNVRVIEPRRASDAELTLFHTPEYIGAVRALSAGETGVEAWRYNFGPGDNPVFLGMDESERLKVGGALLAAEMLLTGECDVAFNYAGGLHHAWRDHASGFCIYNDAVVAISWLVHKAQRVAYVDVDVHHGDGVQYAFDDTDRVMTISLHQDGHTLFPGTGFVEEVGRGEGEGYSINLPLPPFTLDEDYLWAFDQVVPPLLHRYQADILVTQLGVDTHYLDPLAELALTTRGQQAVFERLAVLAPSKWLALGGGGYNLDVVPRAWGLAFATMAGLSLPKVLPAGYLSRYGGESLHDQESPVVDDHLRERVRTIVEERVARLRELHHIT